jgi:hypothetical protein
VSILSSCFTSWHFAFSCIALSISALSLPSADLAPNFRSACRLPVSDRDIERPKIQSFKSFEQTAAE